MRFLCLVQASQYCKAWGLHNNYILTKRLAEFRMVDAHRSVSMMCLLPADLQCS